MEATNKDMEFARTKLRQLLDRIARELEAAARALRGPA